MFTFFLVVVLVALVLILKELSTNDRRIAKSEDLLEDAIAVEEIAKINKLVKETITRVEKGEYNGNK